MIDNTQNRKLKIVQHTHKKMGTENSDAP